MKKVLFAAVFLLAWQGFAQPSKYTRHEKIDSLNAAYLYFGAGDGFSQYGGGVKAPPFIVLPDSALTPVNSGYTGALYRVGTHVYLWYQDTSSGAPAQRIELTGTGGSGSSSVANLGGTYGWYSSSSGGVLGFKGLALSSGSGLTVSAQDANSITLSTDPTIIPRLLFNNTFTGAQTINTTTHVTGLSALDVTNNAPAGLAGSFSATTTQPTLSVSNLGSGMGITSSSNSGAAGFFYSTSGSALYAHTSTGVGLTMDADPGTSALLNFRYAGNTKLYLSPSGGLSTEAIDANVITLNGSYSNWSLLWAGPSGSFNTLAPGTSGKVLTSGGTYLYWATPSGGSGGVPAYTADSTDFLGGDSTWHKATDIQSNTGEVLYDSAGTIRSSSLEAYVKIDSASLSTSGQYDLMYSNRKIHIDSLVIVLVSSGSPSIVFNLRYSQDRSAGGTALINSPSAVTNTTSGARAGGFDNPHVPSGNWVWVTTPTVTTKPFRALVVVKYTYE